MSSLRVPMQARKLLAASRLARVAPSVSVSTKLRPNLSIQAAVPTPIRLFSVSSTRRDSAAQTDSVPTDPPARPYPRLVTFLKVPKRLANRDLEEYLASHNIPITKVNMQYEIDTFYNSRFAIVEFPTEDAATQALALHGRTDFAAADAAAAITSTNMRNKIRSRNARLRAAGKPEIKEPASENSEPKHYEVVARPSITPWDRDDPHSHPKSKNSDLLFEYDGYDSVMAALKPAIEERRVRVQAQPPGLGPENQEGSTAGMNPRSRSTQKVLHELLDEYGVERVGRPVLNGHQRRDWVRYMCHVDFTTKEGTQRAIEAFGGEEGKEVDGNRVVLTSSGLLSRQRWQQLGRLEPRALEEMKKLGLTHEFEENEQEDK